MYGDPNQALFFGGMGIVCALVFGNLGAAYGTAKSGVGICSVAVLRPELIFKSIIPVVMAGILGIYGLIISVIIAGNCKCDVGLVSHVCNIDITESIFNVDVMM